MAERTHRWSADPRVLFLAVTAVALGLRLAHILAFSDPAVNPSCLAPVIDAGVHDRWARGLLAGTWPGPEPFFRAPLYPYFLALLHAVLGTDHPLAIQAAHGVVSALGAGLAALCAHRIWDARAGWAAGLLLAGSWSSIWFAGELLAVSLAVTLNLLALWVLLGGAGGRRLVAAGVVLGLAALTRPTVLAVVPAILWYVVRLRGPALRPALTGAAALVAGLAVAVLPVTVRNIVQGGEPVLIAASGGVNFAIGNNPWSDGRVAFLPGAPPTWQGEMSDVVALASRESGHRQTALGADRWFWRKGLAFWRDQPGAAAALTARKAWLVLAAGERSNNKNLAFWSARSPVLRWPVWPGWALVLGLAVLGLARPDLDPDRRRLLVGLSVLTAAVLVVFFVNARFRLPLLAWLTVPAGGGLAALWPRGVPARTWPGRRRWGAIATLCALVSFAPDAVTYRQDPATDFESWRALGNTYLQIGDPARAVEAWEGALAADTAAPRDAYRLVLPQLFRPLVRVHQEQRRPDLALAAQRRWVQRLPDDDTARVGLANLLLAEGRARDARRELDLVLARSPGHVEARLGRAWVLHGEGDLAAALVDFEDVARAVDSPSADLGAGLCLIAFQRWTEAETRLRALLATHPDVWQADENLAELYLVTGRFGDEQDCWRRVLSARPDHPRARERLAALGR